MIRDCKFRLNSKGLKSAWYEGVYHEGMNLGEGLTIEDAGGFLHLVQGNDIRFTSLSYRDKCYANTAPERALFYIVGIEWSKTYDYIIQDIELGHVNSVCAVGVQKVSPFEGRDKTAPIRKGSFDFDKSVLATYRKVAESIIDPHDVSTINKVALRMASEEEKRIAEKQVREDSLRYHLE